MICQRLLKCVINMFPHIHCPDGTKVLSIQTRISVPLHCVMHCSPVQQEVPCSELIPKCAVFLFQSSCDKDVILNILSVLTDLLSLGKEAKIWGKGCGQGQKRGPQVSQGIHICIQTWPGVCKVKKI